MVAFWLRNSLFVVLILVNSGCKPGNPRAKAKESVHPAVNTQRLSFPSGWGEFEDKVKDVAFGFSKLTAQEAQELSSQAEEFANSDRRPHPHDIGLIPAAFEFAALALASSGDTDAALEQLVLLNKYGGVTPDVVSDESFGDMQQLPEFQRLADLAEQNGSVKPASLLIKQPPLCSIGDLLSVKTTPALPAPSSFQGKVTVVYTGRNLSAEITEQLNDAAAAGASVVAILSNQSESPTTINTYVVTDNSIKLHVLTWFANKDGQVVSFLRPGSGKKWTRAIVEAM